MVALPYCDSFSKVMSRMLSGSTSLTIEQCVSSLRLMISKFSSPSISLRRDSFSSSANKVKSFKKLPEQTNL